MKVTALFVAATMAALLTAWPGAADQDRQRPHDPSIIEIGTGSWYGPGFHGRLTANGEIFDQSKLTAAHRTLPLPSKIEVTNLANNRSIVLRVNDRGPYIDGRIVDVSKRAAEILGFEKEGLAKVRIEVID